MDGPFSGRVALITGGQYRIRKAEESLGRRVSDDRHDVEFALQACHRLGPAVLRPAAAGRDRDPRR